jgi:RNA polymerase sigma-70 factor, ECF subfamily
MFLNRLSSNTDEALMNLICKGEERAFTELYKRYSKLILRYFLRMLWKDEAKAQDFLHDLFVKIIERPQAFDNSRKFSTWVYSVAHNMCKNEYRKHAFRTQAGVAETMADNVFANKIDDIIDHEHFMRTVDRAMLAWPEDDKTLFALRHELETPFAEIAIILNCPEGTVKSRWFYLKKNLAQQLHEFQTLIR